MKNNEAKKGYRIFELDTITVQAIANRWNLGSVFAVKRFEKGMINDTFLVNDAYVVKVNTAHPDWPKLEKEGVIYQACSSGIIPVPVFVAYDDSLSVIPFPYLVYRAIPGESLDGVWQEYDAKDQERLAEEMGELLGKIHGISLENVHLPGQKIYPGLRNTITQRIEAIVEKLKSSDVLPHDEREGIRRFYVESEMFNDSVLPSLLHGNYTFGNTIVAEKKIVGIIDWEFSSVGHSEEELAVVLYRVFSHDHQRECFRRGYTKHRAIDSAFDRRYLAYALLYFLTVLPEVPQWTHRPDKQKEYMNQAQMLMQQLGIGAQ